MKYSAGLQATTWKIPGLGSRGTGDRRGGQRCAPFRRPKFGGLFQGARGSAGRKAYYDIIGQWCKRAGLVKALQAGCVPESADHFIDKFQKAGFSKALASQIPVRHTKLGF